MGATAAHSDLIIIRVLQMRGINMHGPLRETSVTYSRNMALRSANNARVRRTTGTESRREVNYSPP